jgi:hypothetical protein
MKKIMYHSCIFIIWAYASLSTAFADGLTLVDSDGDKYQIGAYIGRVFNNESYFVKYISEAPFEPTIVAEGFVYYDKNNYCDPFGGDAGCLARPIKIVIFETFDIYGFTLEGHWNGDGSIVHYMNNSGENGRMGMFIENSFVSRRSKDKRIKHVVKEGSFAK